MTSVLQPSLSGGELAPGLYGRVDLQRYQTSLALCRNAIPQPYGGIKNRPGTRYCGDAKSHSARSRLIPFQYDQDQTYVLEFGNLYMRVWKDAGQVLLDPAPSAYAGGTTYALGDHVSSGGVNYYSLQNANTGHTPASSPTWWYPLTGLVVEIPTPYTTADIPDLAFCQSADVIYLAHRSHAPRQLNRYDHDKWTLTALPYTGGPFTDINTDQTSTVTPSGVTGSITLTATDNIFASANEGQLFYLEMADYGQPWEPGKAVAIGDIRRSDGKYYESLSMDTTGTLRPVNNSGWWNDGVVTWNYLHSGFGVCLITKVNSATSADATVVNRLPGEYLSGLYRWAFCDWGGNNGYPGSVAIHQQRLCFAGSTGNPETIWMSRTGSYPDFGFSAPTVADDSITASTASTQVQEIRALLPMSRLAVLAGAGIWIISAGDSDAITPSNIGAKLQGYRGSARIRPLGIGNSAVYVQEKGHIVRDLGYDFASDNYMATDLCAMASHLLEARNIEEWAWQEVPHQAVWAVCSDGMLLSMTYLKEQQVIGWARHETDGIVESAAIISENNEDTLYLIVRRSINGATKRYVERMATRQVLEITDAWFVDCGLDFDGTNTTSVTMTLSGGTLWNEGELLTLTAVSATFTGSSDIGDQIIFQVGDAIYRLTITAFTSTTQVTVRANRLIPASHRATAFSSWSWARNTFTGLSHLEGKTVSVLADGLVQPQQVVTGGQISLSPAAVKVIVGLPYNSDLQTLDPSLQTPETVMDKYKQITHVRILVGESRGVWAGRRFDALYEAKTRSFEYYDSPPNLQTGITEVAIACHWDRSGQICLRQSDPLPITWLAIIPDLVVGG